MWLSRHWKDYKIIAAGSGEKLEKWGDYLLIRPDPQIIWEREHINPLWNKADAHYHRSVRGGGEWKLFSLPKQWSIAYDLDDLSAPSASLTDTSDYKSGNGGSQQTCMPKQLIFNLKPFSFKHTGLFPEQASNWDFSFNLIKKRINSGMPVKLLNLFAYTGAATLAAAAAGAKVTHVDASKGMVNWAKENAVSSGLDNAGIRWLVDDCLKFVEREIRRGNKYEAVIMDPPSYGRGPKGEVWKLETSVYSLIKASLKLMSDTPLFFLINSYTTGLQAGVLNYMVSSAVNALKLPKCSLVEADELGLYVEEDSLILPCGAAARAVW